MAFNLNGIATDVDFKFLNRFGSKTNTLLKSYIDSQLLLIRLKKLEEQGSTRDLNGEECKELAHCVALYMDLKRPGGVHKVSEKENDQLKNDVKSLLQDLQQTHGGDAFKEHDVFNLDVKEAGEKAADKLTYRESFKLFNAARILAGPQNAPNAATEKTLLEAADIIARLQGAADGGKPGGGIIADMVARAMAAQGNLGAGVSAGVKQPAGKRTQWERHTEADGDVYYTHDLHESVRELPAGDTWIDGDKATKARFQIINPYFVS